MNTNHSHSGSNISRATHCLSVGALFLSTFAAPSLMLARAAGVDPQSVSETVNAGSCITVTKTIHTPPIPPKPDIVFLADNTGSMLGAIANVQANADAILAAVDGADPDAQFGVASYTDFDCTDPFPYLLGHAITANNTDVLNAINAWFAGDGCDTPEAQLNALYQIATDPATGFRSASTRIVVWFGDSSGHDPSGGHTLTDAINALVSAGVRVIAIPVDTGGAGDGLDSTGQATAITSATGGVLLPNATPDQVSDAILAGLSNLPITVSPSVGTCDSSLAVTFDQDSLTVTSGDDAVFEEKICVDANASQCGSIQCEVDWLLDGKQPLLQDGSVDPAFVQSITIAVPDVTPPTGVCVQGTNPAGGNIPGENANPNAGQNPDGFYTLLARDNCDPSPAIFIKDSASSFIAGPFAPGSVVKITQAPGVVPNQKPGTGVVVAKIQLKGDGLLYAVDASGNVSAVSDCHVPPPPK